MLFHPGLNNMDKNLNIMNISNKKKYKYIVFEEATYNR